MVAIQFKTNLDKSESKKLIKQHRYSGSYFQVTKK